MNIKHLTALLILSASAGTVLADTDTPWNPPPGFTRSRAEVVAELAQDHSQHWQANGDAEYPMTPPAVEPGKTRQQVVAELKTAQGGMVYNSLNALYTG